MYENLAATADLVKSAARRHLSPGLETFVDLFTEDAVFENPYPGNGPPLRLEGKEAIVAFMRDTQHEVYLEEMTLKAAYEFADTDGLVIEYEGTVRLITAGRRFRQTYISVLLFRHGRVSHFREYGNPLAARGGWSALPNDAG